MPTPMKKAKVPARTAPATKPKVRGRAKVAEKKPEIWEFPFIDPDVDDNPNIFVADPVDLRFNWENIMAAVLSTLRRRGIGVELQFNKSIGFHISFDLGEDGAWGNPPGVLPLHRDEIGASVRQDYLELLQQIATFEVEYRRMQAKAEKRQKAIDSLQDWQREALGI